uniref:Uncharacterized protein n=1 Tax=Rhizophora mucronata TaxID=61149 RepID=A0A2P2QII5_RHIMU
MMTPPPATDVDEELCFPSRLIAGASASLDSSDKDSAVLDAGGSAILATGPLGSDSI